MRSELLEGSVSKEDALQIKKMLNQDRTLGNRFVVFPTDTEGLKKEDFTAFRSAFDAAENAYENSTDRDRYIARPISEVETEMDKLLGLKRNHSQEQQNDRQSEKSGEDGLTFLL